MTLMRSSVDRTGIAVSSTTGTSRRDASARPGVARRAAVALERTTEPESGRAVDHHRHQPVRERHPLYRAGGEQRRCDL